MLPCYKSVKIVLDKILALVLIVVLSPVFCIIALILLFSGNGVFYTQQRIGLLERPFKLYKFKTMSDSLEANEQSRITSVGKVLRKYSLDELPQLWNILKEDMSFIGPRPLLIEYLPLYSEQHKLRHWVMPGITGLAQVKGKNNLSWKDKFDSDIYYQQNMSFWLDLKVLFLTLAYFLKSNEGSQPAQKFTGYHLNN